MPIYLIIFRTTTFFLSPFFFCGNAFTIVSINGSNNSSKTSKFILFISSNPTDLPSFVKHSANNEAIAAIEDVSNYKEQALPKMKETIDMFSDMAKDGQKVVEKIETNNNNRLQ